MSDSKPKTEEVLRQISEATSDEEKLRIELAALEDTAKPIDPLETDS